MTETSREELVAVERELEEKIKLLAQKIDFIPDPFSKLSMNQIRRGGSGAARLRRIPLYSDHASEVPDVDTHGNFLVMSHADLADSASDIIYYDGVIIPTDYIATGQMTINYFYSNEGTTGVIRLITVVKSLEDSATSSVSLLSDTTNVTVPGVADTITKRSIALTTLPKTNTGLFVYIQRLGVADSNNSMTSIWNAWLEYVSFI